MLTFSLADISVARKLYEDSEYLGIEIVKDDDSILTEDPDGDTHYFLLFIKKCSTGEILIVKPWEEADD